MLSGKPEPRENSKVQSISSALLLSYTTLSETFCSEIRAASLLLPQILHDPLRQRFGRGGVLAGVQLTVNDDFGLERFICALKLPPEFRDLVLQQEAEVLSYVSMRSRRKVLTHGLHTSAV